MSRRPFFGLLVLIAGCGTPAPIEDPQGVKLETFGPGYHEQSAEIAGVGQVLYSIQIPEGYDGSRPVPLVLVLHYGYNGSKPDPYTGGELGKEFAKGLASLNAIVVAPDVVGGDWTKAKNEKAAIYLTRSVMQSYNIDPKKVVVSGFSMGGEGTWFLGSRHPDLFTGAIPVAAPLAGNDKGWKIPAYVIHSQNDQVVPFQPAKKHADKLAAQGARIEFKSITGVTHYATEQYAPYLGEAAEWLEAEWKK